MAERQRITDNQPQPAKEAQIERYRVEYLPLLFLAVSLLFIPDETSSPAVNSLAVIFISIVLEAIPFMLFGALVGGFIEVFVSRERMTGMIPRRQWLAVLVAAGAGIVFPVCECAVVPVVRRLLGKGLPLSAAIAYLLAGPIVNPVVAASTALAYAFDWLIVVLRFGLAYGIAVTVGLLMGRLAHQKEALHTDINVISAGSQVNGCHALVVGETANRDPRILPMYTQHNHELNCACGSDDAWPVDDWIGRIGAAFTHAKNDFLAVGHYLIIGAFIAALAQTYLDRSIFLGFAGIPAFSILFMMALAILLNLCSEADAFIAASFQGLLPVPAQLAFLLTGPMFDLKLLLMYQSVFTRRTIILLSSLILLSILAITSGISLLEGLVQ